MFEFVDDIGPRDDGGQGDIVVEGRGAKNCALCWNPIGVSGISPGSNDDCLDKSSPEIGETPVTFCV